MCIRDSYGGLTFYINKMLDDGSKVFQGIYYPKVKAAMQGETYTTKGESITLVTDKLKFAGSIAKNGDWKIMSDDFPTEEKAVQWCDAKLGPAAAALSSVSAGGEAK